MACCTAHTDTRLEATSKSPITVLSTACKRLSLEDCHNHFIMVRAGYTVLGFFIYNTSVNNYL